MGLVETPAGMLSGDCCYKFAYRQGAEKADARDLLAASA